MVKKETEVIKLSKKEDSANAGQYASRILRSLEEDKNVILQYVVEGPNTSEIEEKYMKIVRITKRMLNENNLQKRENYDILTTLPERSKVKIENSNDEDKKITINSVRFIRVAKK